MILYHGTNCSINGIDLTMCKPYKDFGSGFYLTTIKEQAEKMATRVARIYGGSPIVNVFKYNPDDNLQLNVKEFTRPNEEWARFVINNRNGNASDMPNNLDNRFDIVIGPIANDDLALLFRQFTNGMISIEVLIKEMEFKKLTNQYSFHTPRAITLLKKDSEYSV